MAGFFAGLSNVLGQAGAGFGAGDQLRQQYQINQLGLKQAQQEYADYANQRKLLQSLANDKRYNQDPLFRLAVASGDKGLTAYIASKIKQQAAGGGDQVSVLIDRAKQLADAGDQATAQKWYNAAFYLSHGFKFQQAMLMAGLPTTVVDDATEQSRQNKAFLGAPALPMSGSPPTPGATPTPGGLPPPSEAGGTPSPSATTLPPTGSDPNVAKARAFATVPASAAMDGAGAAPLMPPPAPAVPAGTSLSASDKALDANDFGAWMAANPDVARRVTNDQAATMFKNEQTKRREDLYKQGKDKEAVKEKQEKLAEKRKPTAQEQQFLDDYAAVMAAERGLEKAARPLLGAGLVQSQIYARMFNAGKLSPDDPWFQYFFAVNQARQYIARATSPRVGSGGAAFQKFTGIQLPRGAESLSPMPPVAALGLTKETVMGANAPMRGAYEQIINRLRAQGVNPNQFFHIPSKLSTTGEGTAEGDALIQRYKNLAGPTASPIASPTPAAP